MGHHVDYGAMIANSPRTMPSGVKSAALALMAVGLAAAGYGFFTDATRASGAFIVNFMYWAGIAQGGLMFAVAMVIVKARWARPLKRMAESFALMLIPMYLLLMAFFLLGGLDVYEWSHWTEATAPHHKWIYFQKPFFLARVGGLIGLLIVLDLLFIRASVRSDAGVAADKYGWQPTGLAAVIGGIGGWKGEAAEVEASQAFQRNIAPVIAITYAIAWSVMSVDVSMSLMPYWYTNMYPAWYFMSCLWSAFVYLGLFSLIFRKQLGIEAAFKPSTYHDLGKLTMGFTMFWGYTTFAQYLPIWYGNMTEEIGGILIRTELEPWATVAKAVFMLCFVVPFTMLTSRGLKKTPSGYLTVASILAVGIWLERFLVNMPGVWHHDTLPLGLPEIGMALGFLGLFTFLVIHFLTSAPPVPFSDPWIQPDPDHVHVHPSSHAHH
jgi:hypothetical protein